MHTFGDGASLYGAALMFDEPLPESSLRPLHNAVWQWKKYAAALAVGMGVVMGMRMRMGLGMSMRPSAPVEPSRLSSPISRPRSCEGRQGVRGTLQLVDSRGGGADPIHPAQSRPTGRTKGAATGECRPEVGLTCNVCVEMWRIAAAKFGRSFSAQPTWLAWLNQLTRLVLLGLG